MKKLYLALYAHLSDVLLNFFIDKWLQQTDSPEVNVNLFPALFINIQQERKNYSVGIYRQMVTATIDIYIAQDWHNSTHATADLSEMTHILENCEKVYQALQGFAANEHIQLAAPLQCIADGDEAAASSNVWVYKQTYTCQYKDDTAGQLLKSTTPDLQLAVNG